MREMIEGSAQFKQERDRILDLYYQQKASEQTPDGSDKEQELDVSEDMKEIDQTLKEMEVIRSANYKIDEEFLDLYQEVFDRFDEQIVTAQPFTEYTVDNPPDWYPEHGIWFNQSDVVLSSHDHDQLSPKQPDE